MARNIIISLALMATSLPPFNQHIVWVKCRETAGLCPPGNKTDREREAEMDGEWEGCDFFFFFGGKWEGGKIYKDIEKDEEWDSTDKWEKRGTSQMAIKPKTGKGGEKKLLTRAIIYLLPHLSSSKWHCHHLLAFNATLEPPGTGGEREKGRLVIA